MVMKILDIGIKLIEVVVIIIAVFAITQEANRIFHEACRRSDQLKKYDTLFDNKKEEDETK